MATARGAAQGANEDGPEPVAEQYDICTFTPDGGEICYLLVEEVREDGAGRVVEHERPYRDGAKLDHTGQRARRWRVKACYSNNLTEQGLPDDVVLYPTELNKLIRAIRNEETGDALIPTVGKRRCKVATYSRVDGADPVDTGLIDVVFIEDSEDDVDASSFTDPSVRASAVRLAQQTQFSAQSVGAWDEGLGNLTDFAEELTALMNSPFTTLEDIQSQQRRDKRAIERVHKAHTQPRVPPAPVPPPSNMPFSDPAGATVTRQLVELEDMIGRAEEERYSSRPRTRTYTVQEDTDLFSIAADLKQDPMQLLELNSARVEDPLDLRQGDTIRVYA